MLLVPHEEVGGFLGAGQLVHTSAFKELNIRFVLDEGMPSGNKYTIFVKVSERKPLQLKLISKNGAGHAANVTQNSIHELLNCLAACQKVVAQVNVGRKQTTSFQVTSLSAGSEHAHNVVPACAHATVDIRVAAQHSIVDIERKITACVAEHQGVTLEVCARVPDVLVVDFATSMLYQTVCESIKTQVLQPIELHFEASSDLRWYQAVGIEGFGLTPFTCEQNLHGINESLPVRDLENGIEIFTCIVENI
jgi:acetylornithine deacetylase/succinyl-diaminopimelate desuccinylase-like protein